MTRAPLSNEELTRRVFAFISESIFRGMEEHLGQEHPEFTPEELHAFYYGVDQAATLYQNRSRALVQSDAEEMMTLASHDEGPKH